MKSARQIYKYPLVIVFFAMLVLPTFNSEVKIWEFERKDENRAFRDSIGFDPGYMDKFPGEFEEYYNDNFSFRRPLLDIYHYIKFHYFHISPHPDKTLIGRNGWFFSAGKEIAIIQGRRNYSQLELDKFRNEWDRRAEYFDSKGIKYYWVICPMKHSIYPEYLPFNVGKHSGPGRIDQIKSSLGQSYPDLILDPTADLVASKDTVKLFYKLDNHWNLSAGYIVSNLIVSKIQDDFPDRIIPDIPSYTWNDSILKEGMHYRVLGLEGIYENEKFPRIENERTPASENYGFPHPKYFAYPWEFELHYKNTRDTSGLTVLFIRDSFGKFLIPFVKEPFSDCLFIFDAWQYGINESIIDVFNPDVVVFISVETHIDSIIKE